MTAAEVRRKMLTKLAESKLDARDAQRLGFVPMLSPPSGISLPAPGFVIPYHDADGKANRFFRYRYLEQPKKNGFAALVESKPLRYTQPAGMPPEPYFSRFVPWQEFFALSGSPAFKILITEGELKANCASKLGYACIGLGGVWNFKNRETWLIPSLKRLRWADAPVYIIYDSDAVKNYQVMQGENALAQELLACGAQVYVVRLPTLPGQGKTGLDDYLVAEGTEKFEELLKNTLQWKVSRALHKLNEEIIYVTNPGMVLKFDTRQRMGPGPFMQHIYANRVMEVDAVGPKGAVTKKKNAAVEWIHWDYRGEVDHITYAPGKPTIITEASEVNLWPGWGVAQELVVPGDVSLWKKFMGYFFKDADPEDRKWFEQWLAYPLQYPGTKLFSAVVVHSLAKGTGKSLLGHTMWKIYGQNYSEIDEDTLLSNFNDWAENKQFVMAEEISGGDKRALGDRMKGMITRPLIRINTKFIPKYVLPDCVNYYFNSNHPDSFYIEDDDRRLFVHEIRCGRLVNFDPDFVKAYDRWYKTPACIGHLFHYFLHLDLSGFDPYAPARETEAKRNMLELGRSEAGAWVASVREDPARVLRLGRVDGIIAEPSPHVSHTLMTSEELFAIYTSQNSGGNLTRPGLSRALKYGGFRQVNKGEPVFTARGAVRLWAIQGDRTKLEGMLPKQLTEIYNGERIGKKEKY
jgi:Domain of unknown function (DUF3854)/Family of unknown function (DUF5906)